MDRDRVLQQALSRYADEWEKKTNWNKDIEAPYIPLVSAQIDSFTTWLALKHGGDIYDLMHDLRED